MKHNFQLIPKEKIRMGGPMNIFIRCKNNGCVAGVDWMSLGDPQLLLKKTQAEVPETCPLDKNKVFK